ncbi:hypothetical protein ACF065_25035 [Streptomyces sp. NPDC015232]|uniref:hypothetical protein n=1 Tax=unclassified Streptomyces TaxID=2593676 RepID=UPI0033A4BE24
MKQLGRRRWLWSPITTWQARRLSRKTGIDVDEAWTRIRLTTHPEESHFALARDVLQRALPVRRGG